MNYWNGYRHDFTGQTVKPVSYTDIKLEAQGIYTDQLMAGEEPEDYEAIIARLEKEAKKEND